MTPRVVLDMAEEDYHSHDSVSRSTIWKLHLHSPLHCRVPVEETPAMSFGSAYHAYVLEPTEFGKRYAFKDWDARTPEGKVAAQSASEAGLTLLGEKSREVAGRLRRDMQQMREILSQGFMGKLLSANDAVTEASAFAVDNETGLTMRCRPDRWHPSKGLMWDLKSLADITPYGFIQSCKKFGYHVQEAWYRDVWQAATGKPVKGFMFVCQEKKAPYDFRIYQLAEADVNVGRQIYKRALATYAECLETGMWPGYDKTVETIELPMWAYKED